MKPLLGLFAGSFDPPTKGHLDFIIRASSLVDRLIVAVALNEAKSSFLLSVQERVDILKPI